MLRLVEDVLDAFESLPGDGTVIASGRDDVWLSSRLFVLMFTGIAADVHALDINIGWLTFFRVNVWPMPVPDIMAGGDDSWVASAEIVARAAYCCCGCCC